MAVYITIDGGTTNTRIRLVNGGEVIAAGKISRGAASGIHGRDAWCSSISQTICQLLANAPQYADRISCILASGMITSEFGLYTVDHIPAPAGIADLHDNMVEVMLPDISELPFVFVPGVILVGDDTDMMRGEETELAGIWDASFGECIYVLPGSHTKIIETDAQGRIHRFSILLTGEMANALSGHTILADAVDLTIDTIDPTALLEGCRYAGEYGINRALFQVRIRKNVKRQTPVEVYSFFLGCILSAEIDEILRYPQKTVVIGGRAPLRSALSALLSEYGERNVICLSDDEVDMSVIRGIIRIYEWNNQ
ncbi:MAG: 2-dehydro-3-deoxygalactonokinase [Clostridia bacterium]|nr:2-dehydro-3-deoxygalactonokinase [Clostridia bacterium]